MPGAMPTRQLSFEAHGGPDLTQGSIVYIGAATVLIRYAGFTVLTDPSFGHLADRARLGLGPRPRTAPAPEIDALPSLDLVVLSQLHPRHWDRLTEARLPRSVPVVTTPAAAAALRKRGFVRTVPLATWETVDCEKGAARLRITAMPGRQGPRLVSRLLPSVMGSLLEFETVDGRPLLRLYVTGDTLVYEGIREIRRRYDDIDIALLHLGGSRVLGLRLTMDAAQGVAMMRTVKPRLAVPLHDDTTVASPLSEFQEAVAEAGLSDRVHYLFRGDTFAFKTPHGRLVRTA
jgi:L-ascorbate metabolism protein UlaG (beta-lactamase superfamily)